MIVMYIKIWPPLKMGEPMLWLIQFQHKIGLSWRNQ